jgi:predicted ArsR family transcriptional regulator
MREPLEAVAPRAVRWLEVVADPIRLGILRSLSHVEEATASDLAAEGQASSQTLRRHLEALVSLGVIEEHPAKSDGQTPGRPAARYSLPSEVRSSVQSILEPAAGRPRPTRPPLAHSVAA